MFNKTSLFSPRNIWFYILLSALSLFFYFSASTSKLQGNPSSSFGNACDLFMISDMVLAESKGGMRAFPEYIYPAELTPENVNFLNSYLEDRSEVENTPLDDYTTYRSNLVIQRFGYYFINSLNPFSPSYSIAIIKFLHSVLTATVVLFLLYWFASKIGHTIALILLAFTFMSYSLNISAANLYFCYWHMLIPFLIMAWYCSSKHFKLASTKKILYCIFGLSFFGIAFKALFYFEFITTAAIMMVIPLIYTLVYEQEKIKNIILTLIVAVLGVVTATFSILVLKVVFESFYWGDLATALSATLEHIANRSANVRGDGLMALPFHTDVSFIRKMLTVAKKPTFGLYQFYQCTNIFVWALSFIGGALALFSLRKCEARAKRTLLAMLVSTCVAFLAPMSWYVLMHTHSALHVFECDVLWIYSFQLLAIALLCYAIKCFISQVCNASRS